MSRLPALLLTAGLAAGTAGCSASATGDVQDRVVDITQAANDRDADALRAAAADLVDDVDASVAAGELSSAEATRLTELARQLQADADLIDQDLLDAETARREAEEAARRADEQEAAREAAEEAVKQAEEAARKAEEQARKVLEEAEGKDDEGKDGKGKDDKKDDDEADDG